MINCVAKIYSSEDVLDAGHRTDEDTTLLFEGPALLSAPRRGWQETAAFEGLLAGNLSIHTRTDLSDAKLVVIEQNVQAGAWRVAEGGVNGEGVNWRLTLQRRRSSAD